MKIIAMHEHAAYELIGLTNPPGARKLDKQIRSGRGHYNARATFQAEVTERLCTAEAFLLGKLPQVSDEDLRATYDELDTVIHIAKQIRSRISETLNDRQQQEFI